jgi:hypothetical protein
MAQQQVSSSKQQQAAGKQQARRRSSKQQQAAGKQQASSRQRSGDAMLGCYVNELVPNGPKIYLIPFPAMLMNRCQS